MSSNVIKVYGTKWCPDCYRIRFILDRQSVQYIYIDINKNESAKKIVKELNSGYESVPTIIFQDGSHLSEPTASELIEKLGKYKEI